MSKSIDLLKTTALELQSSPCKYSLENLLRFPIKKITTYSGLDLVFFENCSAGGEQNSKALLKIIAETGSKKKYIHAHEWCCGHGAIGLELLHQGLCDRLSLSDKFLPAIVSAEFSVAINNWQNKVNVYHAEEFSCLPLLGCDLIIADPPHFSNRLQAEKIYESRILNQDGLRQCVDNNWYSHQILFANLKNRLTDDGDLYLYESRLGSDPKIFKSMALTNGLGTVAVYDLSADNYVIHFRVLK